MNTTPVSLLRTLAAALTVAASLVTPAVARTGAAPSPAPTVAACAWDRPGNDPFMGDVVAAVDRYQDIAPDVRQRLKARMVKREYDDVVSIRRDTITGRSRVRYDSAIHDMHFGSATLCRTVTRAAWNAQMQERGLVYCESGQCILVPTVCRNVSRIARAEVGPERAEGDVLEGLLLPPVAALEPLPPPSIDLLAAEKPLFSSISTETTLLGAFAGSGAMAGGDVDDAGSFAGGTGGGAGYGPLAGISPHSEGAAPRVLATPSSPVTPVPEPETWALLAAGLAVLAARRRCLRAAAEASGQVG